MERVMSTGADTRSADFRPEIQALRALAVTAVVLFHLWPSRLTGGFVGVDVFFVISGYLITGHLLREANGGAGIRLPQFWARRVRRLLPASIVVLVACLVLIVSVMPLRVWQVNAQQVATSAVGLQNWALAAQSVNYFGADNQPTLVQHYWSLSLEEQFYLVWPVLLFALFALTRKRSDRARYFAIGVAMTVVFVFSLAYSAYFTAVDPAPAYFSTFTHAWEFAAGGALALLAGRLSHSGWIGRPRLRAVISWLGIVAILVAVITFQGSSGFPGWIAVLPVFGTVAVIAAGSSSSRIARPLLLSWRPVQWVGGASYSIYLWHWPLIVAATAFLVHPLGWKTKLIVLAASLALGFLSKRFVEDPARRSRALNSRTWVNYAIVVVTAAAVVVATLGVSSSASAQELVAQHTAAKKLEAATKSGTSCLGALAMTHPTKCINLHTVDPGFGPDFAADDWGAVAGVNKDGTLPNRSACVDFSGDNAGYLDCTMGNPDGSKTVAIVGDSHALALFEPLLNIATARGWKVRGILLNSCSAALPIRYVKPATAASCNTWRKDVAARIAGDASISMVITTGFTRGQPGPTMASSRAQVVADYAGLWSRWTAAGKRVVVIEDVPLTAGASVPDCVAGSAAIGDPCAVSRSKALAFDPVVRAAAEGNSRVSLINLTSAFCDATECHSVIGGLIAYRDSHHLSGSFALTLTGRLERGIPR
jgi:peptidoglycan/LPS O-acetylase OafA/YrhL